MRLNRFDHSLLVETASIEGESNYTPLKNFSYLDSIVLASPSFDRDPYPNPFSITHNQRGQALSFLFSTPKQFNVNSFHPRSTSTRATRKLNIQPAIYERAPKLPSKIKRQNAHQQWFIEKTRVLHQVYGLSVLKNEQSPLELKLSRASPKSNSKSRRIEDKNGSNQSHKFEHHRKNEIGVLQLPAFSKSPLHRPSNQSRSNESQRLPERGFIKPKENPLPPAGTNNSFIHKRFLRNTHNEGATALPSHHNSPKKQISAETRKAVRLPTPIEEEEHNSTSHRGIDDEIFSEENEYVELALLDSSESHSVKSSRSQSQKPTESGVLSPTPEEILKIEHNLNKEKIIGKVYQPILEKLQATSTSTTFKTIGDSSK